MRFERVKNFGGKLKFICCKCFKIINIDVYADLDDRAFISYYCKECMEEEIKKQTNYQKEG